MRFPPISVSIRTDTAPASSAFSSNSFTTDAGRSTTSPAAILFATASGNIRILLMSSLPLQLWLSPCKLLPLYSSALLFLDPYPYPQLLQLFLIHFAWRFRH